MFLCHPHLTQARVILCSFLSLLAPCRTRHRESRQRLHESGRPTVASGSIPALPTQQMLIQIRIKIIILIIIKKTTRQQQQQHTKQNALYRRQSEERGERKKRGGERERRLFLSQLLCVQERRGGRGKITAKRTQQHLIQNLKSRLSSHRLPRRQHEARERMGHQQGSCRRRMLQCKQSNKTRKANQTEDPFSFLSSFLFSILPHFPSFLLFLSFAERGLCFGVYSHLTFWMPWVIFES